jgi:hypothetical protein
MAPAGVRVGLSSGHFLEYSSGMKIPLILVLPLMFFAFIFGEVLGSHETAAMFISNPVPFLNQTGYHYSIGR